jgi:hypothetical protein
MAFNNDAFYDAVVAGAGGGAQHGWLVLSTPASYTPFATNIDILATAVDLQIPTIAGGPSISQINLLQSITQSVLTARFPVPVAPATYIDIAKAIAAVYTELEKLLTNQPTVASYGVNWLVADWYIDGTVGDDANSGVVIGAPLKTGAELLRRLGPYAMWPQSVTVHVLANGMIDALVLRGLMMVAGNHLDVIGTPTQVADAGTVTSFSARNHVTPIADQITSTLVADWTPYGFARLRITGGVNIGGVAWIATANPAGAGLGVARISKPHRSNLTSATTQHQTITPAIGDPIIVEVLPEIPCLTIEVDGPLNQAATAAYYRRQVGVFNVDTRNLEVNTQSAEIPTYLVVQGVRCCSVYAYPGNTNKSSLGSIGGSMVYSRDGSASSTIQFPNACLVNCLVADCNGKQAMQAFANCIGISILFQAIGLNVPSICIFQMADIQIFDVPLATADAANLSTGRVQNISGGGNAGYGIGVPNKSLLTFSAGTVNLQGAVSNARLSSAPAIALTIPQFNQPSDYAQKGITPALVAGTTTVTVPWYDNATQRVTVSHAAFAGTPGILSVQQISNTQFTITSSSALDTSTVNWTISPLGRNIFISTV